MSKAEKNLYSRVDELVLDLVAAGTDDLTAIFNECDDFGCIQTTYGMDRFVESLRCWGFTVVDGRVSL